MVSKSNVFYIGIVCFFVGILARSLFFDCPQSLVYLNAGLLLGLIVFALWHHLNWKFFLQGFFWLVMLTAGVLRTDQFLKFTEPFSGWNYSGLAKVVSLAEDKGDYQRFFVELDNKMRLVVYGSVYQEVLPGQQLQISCEVVSAENKFPKFNFVRFLAKNKASGICSGAKFEIKRDGIETGFYRGLMVVRHSLEKRIDTVFNFNEGAYLAGLLLGGDNRLSEEVANNFQITGTTHTVAVSGYNIAIISNFFLYSLIFVGLWRRQAFWISLIAVTLFVILIGAPSSAVRAGVMGSLTLFSLMIGRPGGSVRMLILTSFVIGVYSPLMLLYDLGFQLSFLACLGIVLIYGPVSRKIGVEKDFLELKSIFLGDFVGSIRSIGDIDL